ncbi:MAG: hypothetical protein JXR58_07260 [Bacteroidales bacterium]|nr:hypothetical protein [Bacteroidales bacterium]
MKSIFWFILLLLTLPSLAQNNIMAGHIDIKSKQGKLTEDFTITNIITDNKELKFTLHKYLEVEKILLNSIEQSFIIDSSEQLYLVNLYKITLNRIPSKTDSLRFIVSGSFEVSNDSSKYNVESDFDLVTNYSIFRANGMSSWHPVIIQDSCERIDQCRRRKKIEYSIQVKCDDCQFINIGDVKPQPSPVNYKQTSSLPMIIAGDYKWEEIENIILINIDSAVQQKLVNETRKIITYYEKLLGIEHNSNPVYAKVEINKNLTYEFAFFSLPTIVFVNRRNNKKITNYGASSHELAHYYFGSLFVPKSNLHWFLNESITEFFSFKFLLHDGNTSKLSNKYNNLKAIKICSYIPFLKKINGFPFRFVRLDKIKHKDEIHEMQRYNISPFQLLAIERIIGEKLMIEFIKKLYANVSNNKHGYETLIQTLKEIGLEKKTIKKIERNYFKNFKLRKYKFVKELINN